MRCLLAYLKAAYPGWRLPRATQKSGNINYQALRVARWSAEGKLHRFNLAATGLPKARDQPFFALNRAAKTFKMHDLASSVWQGWC